MHIFKHKKTAQLTKNSKKTMFLENSLVNMPNVCYYIHTVDEEMGGKTGKTCKHLHF